MDLINFNLMKHPINWVTVVLMVLIGAMALHFVLKGIGQVGTVTGGPTPPGSVS